MKGLMELIVALCGFVAEYGRHEYEPSLHLYTWKSRSVIYIYIPV